LEPDFQRTLGKAAGKSTRIITCVISRRDTLRSFSLRRGLDSSLDLLQAGHHPSVLVCPVRLRNDEGDLPVALASSCYAASFLAHPPLSEGWHVAVIDSRVRARQRRGGLGRFEKERMGVGGHDHHFDVMPGRRIAQTHFVGKRSGERLTSGSPRTRENRMPTFHIVI
jgi:hypothetical protein